MLPNNKGYYGKFGGRFVPEILMGLLEELATSYSKIKKEKWFTERLKKVMRVQNLSEKGRSGSYRSS